MLRLNSSRENTPRPTCLFDGNQTAGCAREHHLLFHMLRGLKVSNGKRVWMPRPVFDWKKTSGVCRERRLHNTARVKGMTISNGVRVRIPRSVFDGKKTRGGLQRTSPVDHGTGYRRRTRQDIICHVGRLIDRSPTRNQTHTK